MNVENGKIEGNFTVVAGGKLHLRGTCSNNLIVQPGGSAFLYGTVGSDVHNAGSVEVEDTVNGSVLSTGAPLRKSVGAFIRGTFAM